MKILLTFLISILLFTDASATIRTVDDDGGAQFIKIQDAIDAASDGDTVFVFNGFYEECISILNNIFLIGENNQQTIISSDQSKFYTILTYNSFIENLKIVNGDHGILFGESKGIFLNNYISENEKGLVIPFGKKRNSDLLIHNNYIINNHEGIFFDTENPGITDSIKIIANSITDNDYGIVYFPEQIISGPPFDTTWNVNADSNYWGYSDQDSIAEYIWDKNDSDKAIAQLHYDYWYTDSLENKPVNITTGIHHNNIYNNSLYNVYAFDDQGTGINEVPTTQPNNFRLYQNYPNPFNNNTVINLYMNEPSEIELYIYDINGRRVKYILKGPLTTGNHRIEWNGMDDSGKTVSSGTYYLVLKGKGITKQIKLLLIK